MKHLKTTKQRNIIIKWFLILALITLGLTLAGSVHANDVRVTASVPCNPYNCEFVIDGNRGGTGEVMGTPFTATMVISEPEIVKFQTPYLFWYVTDKGIIWAETNIQALSIYLYED